MANAPPPPLAIRITRPYDTEDEYLAHELDTLSRASITLVGAQQRPQGVVLRFELVLSGGQVLLRGEGRVVAFKPNAHQGVGGLTLRFTRIDARSKALLDKAVALREMRRPSSKPPKEAPAPAEAPAAPAPRSEPPRARAAEPPAPLPQPPAAEASPEPPAISPLPLVLAAPPRDVAPAPGVSRGRAEPVAAPPGRDELLERLRIRAKTLDVSAVQRILAQRHNT